MSAPTLLPPRRPLYLLQREIEGRAALQSLEPREDDDPTYPEEDCA